MDDVWGTPVTRALIACIRRRFSIGFGPEQRRLVIELAEGIRRDRMAGDVARNGYEAWKCGRCRCSETADRR